MRTLSVAILMPLALTAQTLVPVRYQVTTDADHVYPAGILATAAEVGAVSADAASAQTANAANAAEAAALRADVDALAADVADATSDGVWALSLFCTSVGFAAQQPDGTSRLEWVTVPSPTNASARFRADNPLDLDRLDLIATVTLDEMVDGIPDGTATVTEAGTSDFPDGTPGWLYTVTLADLPDADSAFFKLVYDDMLVIGTGNTFPIVGALSVDGAAGRTVTVDAVDATTGEPVTLTFVGGLLVDPVAIQTEEAAE